MKKIICLLVLMLLLSGCTVKSNITIQYDGSVKEEVFVLTDNSSFKDDEDFKEVVDNKINSYKNILDFRNYEYSYEKESELSGAKVYKNYDNICNFFGNSVFNQYVYKYIDCNEQEDFIEIKNSTPYITYCPECGNWPSLDNVSFSITLPIEALENNADEVDKNTYIWKYDSNTKDKDFYLKISKTKLKEYEKTHLKTLKIKKKVKIGFVIIGVIAVFIAIMFVTKILYKKHQENKLDY